MYAHLIFDIDGTLLNSGDAVVNALLTVADLYIHDGADERLCRETLAMNTEAALRYIGVADLHLAQAVARFDAVYARDHAVTAYPGIADTLQLLRSHPVTLSILSARKAYEIERDPSFAVLKPYFSVLMDADYAAPKPSPDSLIRYMREQRVKPEEILLIGDTQSDSGCACAAGVSFALAGWNAQANPGAVPHRYWLKQPADIIPLALPRR